jgi:hypothetical protein
MDTITSLVLGTGLLLFGRRAFWLFVAACGFLAGVSIAPLVLRGQPQWLVIGIGLFVGFLGALLAVFLQKVAVWLAGFFCGGYLVSTLLESIGVITSQNSWLAFIIGGFIGALLLVLLFNWALIILSSLAGANFILQGIRVTGVPSVGLFILLVVVGIVVQGILLKKK